MSVFRTFNPPLMVTCKGSPPSASARQMNRYSVPVAVGMVTVLVEDIAPAVSSASEIEASADHPQIKIVHQGQASLPLRG